MLLCVLYLLLFGVDAAVVYLHIKSLFLLYHIYVVPAYTLSRITQLAIPYMLILATLERLAWISGRADSSVLKYFHQARGRNIVMVVTVLFCITGRLPTLFAVKVCYK
ncbi:hypothetical protein AB6A40_010894 [Gnathostoma spinigerum]|uniref:G-protein coupled receptors family 1 profile domain-containing protein n=1 Tax=Gnathostoma spinigerum TaxID=75299 RepID=A0ABD6EW71_9BILA